MNAHNGKIARLPRALREDVNERLERSQPSPQLLAWLNALPEARGIVQDEFASSPINKQNLSNWRLGGFQEWLIRRDFWAEARKRMENLDQSNQSKLGNPRSKSE